MIESLAKRLKKQSLDEKGKVLSVYRQFLLRDDDLSTNEEQQLTEVMAVLGRSADHLEADADLFTELAQAQELVGSMDLDERHSALKQVLREKKKLSDLAEAELTRITKERDEKDAELDQQRRAIDRQIQSVKDAKGRLPLLQDQVEETFGIAVE